MYIYTFVDEKKRKSKHLLYTIQGPLRIYKICVILLILLKKCRRGSIRKNPLSTENGYILRRAPNRNRTCIFSSAGILGRCLFECFIVGETRIVKNVISHVSKKCPFSENGLFSPFGNLETRLAITWLKYSVNTPLARENLPSK